jgi:hypothetical protein
MSADNIIRRLTQPSTAATARGAMTGEEHYMVLARLADGRGDRVPGRIVTPDTASQMTH